MQSLVSPDTCTTVTPRSASSVHQDPTSPSGDRQAAGRVPPTPQPTPLGRVPLTCARVTYFNCILVLNILLSCRPFMSFLHQGRCWHHGVTKLSRRVSSKDFEQYLNLSSYTFQIEAECRWRVSPGHTRRVLLILPRLSLPSDCSSTLTISRSANGKSSPVFSTCTSTSQPLILTGQSTNLWVEFRAGGKMAAQGFQLTALSVQGKLRGVPIFCYELFIRFCCFHKIKNICRGTWLPCRCHHQLWRNHQS